MFNSATKEQFLNDLRMMDPDMKVVIACDYGDRCHTTQAIPATEVNELYLEDSAYSDSNYKLCEDGDQDSDNAPQVISLNAEDNYSMDTAFTVSELIDELECAYEDDMLVAMGADFGDRSHTIQAIAVSDVGTAFISKSGYSLSGYKVVEDGDQEDGDEEVVVINVDVL